MIVDVLIAVAAAVVAGAAGIPLVPLFLRLTEKRGRSKDSASAASRKPLTGTEDIEVLHGGRWVGIIERALIAGVIVLGRPELMAIVVAIKGLGRFAEIKSSARAGEKFIIGTFASIAIASVIGAVGWALAG